MRDAIGILIIILTFNALGSLNAFIFHLLGPDFEWWKGSISIFSVSMSIYVFCVVYELQARWRYRK